MPETHPSSKEKFADGTPIQDLFRISDTLWITDKGHPIQDIFRTPAGYPMAASDVRGSIGYGYCVLCGTRQVIKVKVTLLQITNC